MGKETCSISSFGWLHVDPEVSPLDAYDCADFTQRYTKTKS